MILLVLFCFLILCWRHIVFYLFILLKTDTCSCMLILSVTGWSLVTMSSMYVHLRPVLAWQTAVVINTKSKRLHLAVFFFYSSAYFFIFWYLAPYAHHARAQMRVCGHESPRPCAGLTKIQFRCNFFARVNTTGCNKIKLAGTTYNTLFLYAHHAHAQMAVFGHVPQTCGRLTHHGINITRKRKISVWVIFWKIIPLVLNHDKIPGLAVFAICSCSPCPEDGLRPWVSWTCSSDLWRAYTRKKMHKYWYLKWTLLYCFFSSYDNNTPSSQYLLHSPSHAQMSL